MSFFYLLTRSGRSHSPVANMLSESTGTQLVQEICGFKSDYIRQTLAKAPARIAWSERERKQVIIRRDDVRRCQFYREFNKLPIARIPPIFKSSVRCSDIIPNE